MSNLRILIETSTAVADSAAREITRLRVTAVASLSALLLAAWLEGIPISIIFLIAMVGIFAIAVSGALVAITRGSAARSTANSLRGVQNAIHGLNSELLIRVMLLDILNSPEAREGLSGDTAIHFRYNLRVLKVLSGHSEDSILADVEKDYLGMVETNSFGRDLNKEQVERLREIILRNTHRRFV